MVGESGWCKVWCGCLGRAEDAENVKGTAVSAGYLDGCGVETRRVLGKRTRWMFQGREDDDVCWLVSSPRAWQVTGRRRIRKSFRPPVAHPRHAPLII
jgi:hypothetical protein